MPRDAPDRDATSSRDYVVELQDVSCYYGSFRAVRNVDIKVAKNAITALIGPSGCGKSTLLRTINRMNDLVPSLPVRGQHPARRPGPVRPGRSIRSRSAGASGWSSRSRTRSRRPSGRTSPSARRSTATRATSTSWWSAASAARRSGTTSRTSSSSPGMALSGGQQQRLCIARTIAVEPEVILMDEPCSALDPRSTLQIEELMAELKRDYTIVIVTHNMQQAARASDTTVFMTMGDDRAGYVVEEGDDRRDLHEPEEPADRGLRLRAVRLSGARHDRPADRSSASQPGRTDRSTVRSSSCRPRAATRPRRPPARRDALDREEQEIKDAVLRMGALVEAGDPAGHPGARRRTTRTSRSTSSRPTRRINEAQRERLALDQRRRSPRSSRSPATCASC